MTFTRRILIMVLASVFAFFPVMPGSIVLAGHSLQSDRSASLSLTPTEKAGDATGNVEIKVGQEGGFDDDFDIMETVSMTISTMMITSSTMTRPSVNGKDGTTTAREQLAIT